MFRTLTEELEQTVRILDLQNLKRAWNYIREIYFAGKCIEDIIPC